MHNPYVTSTPLNYYLEMLGMLDNDASADHKQSLHDVLTTLGQVIQTTVKDKGVYIDEPQVTMETKPVSWFQERVCHTYFTYATPLSEDTPFLTIEVALDQINPESFVGEICEVPDEAINNCLYLTPALLRPYRILARWWQSLPETPVLAGSIVSECEGRVLFRYRTVLITIIVDPSNIINHASNRHASVSQG